MRGMLYPGAKLALPVRTIGFKIKLGVFALALGTAGGTGVVPTAVAQETTTYTYDALGRLKSSGISGGPNAGSTSSISFDPAGNRTNYSVTGAGGPPEISCEISGSNGYSYGGWPVQMMVMRKGNCPAGQQVSYQTADGTGPYAGVAGVDYVATSGTLTFPNAYHNNVQWSYLETSFNVSPTQSPSDVKTFRVLISSINLGSETQIVGSGLGQILPPD